MFGFAGWDTTVHHEGLVHTVAGRGGILLAGVVLLLASAGCSSSQPASSGVFPAKPASGPAAPAVDRNKSIVKGEGAPVSKALNPSNESQSVTFAEKVKVTLPAGFLKAPATLTITPLAGVPDPDVPGVKHQGAFDVSLGDLHDLEQELTIEIAYDTFDGSRNLLWLEDWDAKQQMWIRLPSEVDTQAKVVRARTRQLSPVAVASAEMVADYRGKAVSEADKGKWYYANDYFVMEFNKAEVEQNTGSKVGWYTIPDPNVKPVRADQPRYVEDVWAYLNTAQQKYQAAKLRDLPKFDENAWLFKNGTFVYVGGSGNSYRNKITGNVNVRLDSAGHYKLLNFTVAHELFHSIQNLYYTAAGMTARKWWMEATAEYAADRLAMGGSNMMGGVINPRFLEKQLTYSSSVIWDAAADLNVVSADPHGYHEYTGAFFIDFLVRKKGVDFKELFETVAKGWTAAIESQIDEFLKTKGTDLATSYREFARYWLFDPESPIYSRSNPVVKNLITDVGEPGLPDMLAADKDELSTIVLTDKGYSAKLWGFRVGLKDEDKKKSPPARRITVQLDSSEWGDLWQYAAAEVYKMKATGATRSLPVKTLKPTSADPSSAGSVDLEVGEGEIVYVVAYNSNISAGGRIGIKVTTGPNIKSVTPSPVWYDGEVTLKGSGFGATADKAQLNVLRAGTKQGTVAKPTSWSDSEIKFKLPRGVIDPSKDMAGDAEVLLILGRQQPTNPGVRLVDTLGAGGGVESNRAKFTIGNTGVQIGSVSPAKARLGEELTLIGQGFGASQGNSTVTLNGKIKVEKSQIISWSDKEIRFKVPSNVITGDLVITVGGVESNKAAMVIDWASHLMEMKTLRVLVRAPMTYKVVNPTETKSWNQDGFEIAIPMTLAQPAVGATGNTFNVSSTETKGDGTTLSHSVSGTFDATGSKIVEATVNYSSQAQTFTRVAQVKLRNLPLTQNDPKMWYYSAKGATIGSYAEMVKDDQAWPNAKQTGTLTSVQWDSSSANVALWLNR